MRRLGSTVASESRSSWRLRPTPAHASASRLASGPVRKCAASVAKELRNQLGSELRPAHGWAASHRAEPR